MRHHVLVHDDRAVVGIEKRGERRETERREERVFDRTPVRTGGFGQRGQNQLDAEGAAAGRRG
jgi:hypothetical protein